MKHLILFIIAIITVATSTTPVYADPYEATDTVLFYKDTVSAHKDAIQGIVHYLEKDDTVFITITVPGTDMFVTSHPRLYTEANKPASGIAPTLLTNALFNQTGVKAVGLQKNGVKLILDGKTRFEDIQSSVEEVLGTLTYSSPKYGRKGTNKLDANH